MEGGFVLQLQLKRLAQVGKRRLKGATLAGDVDLEALCDVAVAFPRDGDRETHRRSVARGAGLWQVSPRRGVCDGAIMGAAGRVEGKEARMFDRITFDSGILGGRACIRGMRIPVSVVVGQIAHGATFEEILRDYPDLERDDITQAVEYAAWLAQEEVHFAAGR